MAQIAVCELSKTYTVRRKKAGVRIGREKRKIEALKHVDFEIEKGELVGCIGPNGAGKSTLIKILSGILIPESGRVTVNGMIPWKERVAHVTEIGVIFGQRTQLWWDVPIIDSFNLLGDIYDLSVAEYRKRLDELTVVFAIGDLLTTPLRQLSLGQRMRCELAASLLHAPSILFLDEPTIGLDSASKLRFRDHILEMNRKAGITVILTTHDMDDVETVCRRIMVIGKGEKLYDGSLERLRDRYAPERILTATIEDALPATVPGAKIEKTEGNRLFLRFDPTETPTPRLIADLNRICRVHDLTIEDPDIDEVVSNMYTQEAL